MESRFQKTILAVSRRTIHRSTSIPNWVDGLDLETSVVQTDRFGNVIVMRCLLFCFDHESS